MLYDPSCNFTFVELIQTVLYDPARWLSGRVFVSVPGDRSSISGRVIPKTQNMVFGATCLTLSIMRYVSRVKWSNPGKVVAPFPTPRCSSY